jgi:hypothetical protein
MRFIWDGMPVEKVNGKWISKCWAMKGQVVTGNIMGKEIPEPIQSQIEKDFQQYLKEEKIRDKKRPANRIRPPSKITWTKDNNSRDGNESEKSESKVLESKEKRKINNKKPELSISGLEALIEKERITPATPKKKRGGVIGGMSLVGSKQMSK